MTSTDTLKTTGAGRLTVIDALRGLVIIIMVLDHVRDYFHASGYAYDPIDFHTSTPAVYATRWVTHLCAATFVWLAGVSVWLRHEKTRDTKAVAIFLLTRGLWLVVLECTVVNFGWSFSVPFLPLLQVIWAIGFAMIALAALVWLPRLAVLTIGIVVIAGHNLLDGIQAKSFGAWEGLWMFLHAGGIGMWQGQPFALLFYPVVPWIGVIALGYGMGTVFTAPRRDLILTVCGLAMIAGFVILRMLNVYGTTAPWADQHDTAKTIMDFMNVQKYPPSLDYVLATLGPIFVLIPWLARLKGPFAGFLVTFGSVPLMAYIAHLYVMHALSIAVHFAAGQAWLPFIDTMRHFVLAPDLFKGSGFPLWAVYLGWVATIAIIYPLCRWWQGVKQRRRDWWLSYL